MENIKTIRVSTSGFKASQCPAIVKARKDGRGRPYMYPSITKYKWFWSGFKENIFNSSSVHPWNYFGENVQMWAPKWLFLFWENIVVCLEKQLLNKVNNSFHRSKNGITLENSWSIVYLLDLTNRYKFLSLKVFQRRQ